MVMAFLFIHLHLPDNYKKLKQMVGLKQHYLPHTILVVGVAEIQSKYLSNSLIVLSVAQ